MSVQLPPKPSLEQLKKQAKALLKAHQSGEPDACTRIKASFPRLSEAPESDISGAAFSLRDAQLVIAREYGFESWPKLKRYVETLSEDPHRLLVMRVAHLISEHLEDAAGVVRDMLDEPGKPAILMIALGQEATASVMAYLSDEEIEQISRSIAEMDVVTTEQEDEVLEEFEHLLMAEKGISRDGVDYGAIEKTLSQARAKAIERRIRGTGRRIGELISERPEDAARVIRGLEDDPEKMAIVVNALDGEVLSKLGMEKDEGSEIEGTEQERDVLEEFERLLVARKYVSRGGVEYARGALEKALGPRKAQALLGPIAHEILLDRVSRLISELPEAAGEVIQSMEAELSEVAILVNALDGESLSRLGKEKGEVSEMERGTREQEEEVLEEFERLLVTRKYISRGGVEYARGALEKALGPRKARALLDRVTSASSS